MKKGNQLMSSKVRSSYRFLSSFIVLAFSVSYSSSIYAAPSNCKIKQPSSFLKEQHNDIEWFVVGAANRTDGTTKCTQRIPDMVDSQRIIKQPKLNPVKVNNDGEVVYEAKKLGDDYFEVERKYTAKNGVKGVTYLNFKVHVVDKIAD